MLSAPPSRNTLTSTVPGAPAALRDALLEHRQAGELPGAVDRQREPGRAQQERAPRQAGAGRVGMPGSIAGKAGAGAGVLGAAACGQSCVIRGHVVGGDGDEHAQRVLGQARVRSRAPSRRAPTPSRCGRSARAPRGCGATAASARSARRRRRASSARRDTFAVSLELRLVADLARHLPAGAEGRGVEPAGVVPAGHVRRLEQHLAGLVARATTRRRCRSRGRPRAASPPPGRPAA